MISRVLCFFGLHCGSYSGLTNYFPLTKTHLEETFYRCDDCGFRAIYRRKGPNLVLVQEIDRGALFAITH